MNEGKDNNSIIVAIQSEYNKIDDKWMKLHYYTLVGLVIFGFIIECILGLTWYDVGPVEISPAKYLVKYILSPLLFNSVFIFTGVLVMHMSHLKQRVRIYFISLLFVGVCFIFYIVHSILIRYILFLRYRYC